MKKLMIAAAIVCAAALSQAASVSWSYSGVGNESVGATVYMVSALDNFKSVADIQAAMISADSFGLVEEGRDDDEGVEMGPTNSAWESQDTVDFYAVIVKEGEDGYYASGDKLTASVGKGTATPETLYTETMSADASAANFHSFSSIPEPTSGLLLLLGVAGLALRRKQK